MVTDLPAEQGDRAAVGSDAAAVDDCGVVAVTLKLVIAVVKVLVRQAQG